MTDSQPESFLREPTSLVTILAPAKINLILRILDRCPDGYHNLWSIMHTVGLEDTIRIQLSVDRDDIQLHCDSEHLVADRNNLVYRAALAVLDRTQRSIGLEIELEKRIPMGAGLGGGSSDAAATILGLNRLLGLGWSRAQMAEIGQTLGSDVPFFLFAPSALVAGRGEIVKPVRIEGEKWTVLVNPGFGVETRWAYHELASTRGAVRSLSSVHRSLEQGEFVTWKQIAEAAENDFESPVFSHHGILREIKQALLSHGAEIALLSGSGATVFGVFPNEAQARQAQAWCASMPRCTVYVVPACSTALAVLDG